MQLYAKHREIPGRDCNLFPSRPLHRNGIIPDQAFRDPGWIANEAETCYFPFPRTGRVVRPRVTTAHIKESVMRKPLLKAAILFVFVLPLKAQTADDIIAKFIKTTGGMEKISSVMSLRRTGKFIGGGGFEAAILNENKRPNKVRQDFTFQGMTGTSAYNGKAGWKIEPWSGKKEPEALGEEELKGIIEESDFDGPLVNYQQKGNKVEYLGMEPVEGTDAYKLKVTLANGEIRYFFMDTDYFVPIKIETHRMIRGAEQDFETTLGDYKEVNGWYLPFSVESNVKGSPDRSKLSYETIEANVPIDDSRFEEPVHAPSAK